MQSDFVSLVRTPAMPLRDAFAYCERMARTHYENFPVASFFVPAAQRPFVWSVYAFARTADDFADEGDVRPEDRLAKLDSWAGQLDGCFAGKAVHPVFIALAETVRRTGIPREPFTDLLNAFRADVTTNRYETFGDLLGYCRCSANSVGRLVLAIFGDRSERAAELSDNICTALQLTNFWQDVATDWAKNRVYIPLEDLRRFGYTLEEMKKGVVDERFRALMTFEVERTRELFRAGLPLVPEGPRAIRFELALTLNGGMAILRKIERRSYDVLSSRPALSATSILSILFASMFRRTL